MNVFQGLGIKGFHGLGIKGFHRLGIKGFHGLGNETKTTIRHVRIYNCDLLTIDYFSCVLLIGKLSKRK